MAQVDKIAREVRLKFERPRRLELPAQGSPPSQPVENDVPKITELRDNFLKVANKARRILDASSELAVLRRVPVPLDAKELRAAVVRQDEDSQGLFITYDLYRRALAYLRNRSSAVPLAVFDEFTGDPVLDHRRAGQRLRTLVDGIDADTAELIASQITVLFISKLLQMGLDNLDSGKQTATKQPSSAELPVIAASLAISLAAQLLYAGLTEAEIEASLEELGGAMPSNLNMDAAKQSLRDSSIFQAGLLGKRPGDYELIVDFVRVFLNKQTDPGWDTWQLADDLEGAEALARSSADSLSKYNDVTPPGEPPKTVEVDEGILSSEGALVRNLKARGIGTEGIPLGNGKKLFPLAIGDTYSRALNFLNTAVDRMAMILGHKIDTKQLCCLLNWLNELRPGALDKVKKMGEIWNKTLGDLDSSLDRVKTNAQLSYSADLHQSVMLLLQNILDTTGEAIKDWLTRSEENWKEIFRCALIDEYIEFVVRALEHMGDVLIGYLDRWLSFLEDQDTRLSKRINIVAELKELRILLTTTQAFIDLRNEGVGACDDEDPTQLAASVERVLDRLGPNVVIPITGDDPFDTVQSDPIVTDSGIQIPAVPGASAGQTPMEAAIEVCRDGLIRQNFVPFPSGKRND